MIGPNEKSTDPFGTLGYVAPEVLQKKPYSYSVDLWSLGCIIYALVCSSLPFDSPDQKETISLTIDEELEFDSPQWETTSDECKDFIYQLLIKEPAKRMTIEKAFQHPWLKKVDASKFSEGKKDSANQVKPKK